MNKQLSNIIRYLSNELKPMLRLDGLSNDIFASISVAFVAIPLSLAVSIASGVSPSVGLISAVIGGVLGALFGGTRLGVTGPAVAMSVLIADSVATYGFASLLVIGIICGSLQVIFGIFRLGRFARLIPISLVLAFTAGIGVIIFFNQLPIALGIQSPNIQNTSLIKELILNIHSYTRIVSVPSVSLVLCTILLLKILPKISTKIPHFLLAVLIPSLFIYFIGLKDVSFVGTIPHHLLHTETIDFSLIHNWQRLIITGFEVFLLASLETLLSSNAVDLMGSGDLHNPDQELIGQGVANIGTAIFGGIPVTGVIARSSVNIISGAKTRRSAIFQALIIIGVVYLLPSLIENIPIAVLVGILIAASITMMNFRQVVDLWKGDKLEVIIYVVTFLSIVATDLVDGIRTGLFVAFVIVGIRMLKTKTNVKLWSNKNVLRVTLSGNITFWSYEKLSQIEDYVLNHEDIRFVIFELNRLKNIDSTGVSHLLTIANELKEKNIKVILHGLNDAQQNIINTSSPADKPYVITVAENEIKQILEANGVKHSAKEVLKYGMAKFVSEYAKENIRLITTLAKEQKPHTLLITCSDSRLNPNAFFGANIGELFIVRNVGNVIPPYSPDLIYSEVAAIEFALNELGVRHIVLCAHTECGAIKASIGMNDLPEVGLNNWLSLIRDGFKLHKPYNTDMGVKVNLLHQVQNLKTYPIVKKLLESKELSLTAWIYDVHSGHMLEWDESKSIFFQAV